MIFATLFDMSAVQSCYGCIAVMTWVQQGCGVGPFGW